MKKLGLIINPIAGIGGAVGLKGSDGAKTQKIAWERGAVMRSEEKTGMALEYIRSLAGKIVVYTAAGHMGGDVSLSLGFRTEILADYGERTEGGDTENLACKLAAMPVDLIFFAGGDGTARNVCEGISGTAVPVIGVPSGVKIHSGVYATSPAAAGKTLFDCLSRPSFRTRGAEVMDIDEDAYREGSLSAKLFGYMDVPANEAGMQHPKAASHNMPDDVNGICYEIADRMAREDDPDICYVFGAGSTVQSLMNHLAFDGTLIGVDVVKDGRVMLKDATAQQLTEVVGSHPSRLIVTAIGGQGHIFGRGNQQLSPEVIRAAGSENIWVVAAAAKIFSLKNQALYVDTGDMALDDELRGYMKVIVGRGDYLLCNVL